MKILTNIIIYLITISIKQSDSFIAPRDRYKIVGGQMAPEDSAPYQVSLQATIYGMEPPKYHHFCSGTIVSKNHIVTAAHCLDGGWKPGQVTVVAGTKIWNKNGNRHEVKSFEIHEKYVELNGNDIGMILLKKPLKLGKNISILSFDDEYIDADKECILTGWGYTLSLPDPGFIPPWIHGIFKSYPKDMQMTKMNTITNDECRRSYPSKKLDTELCTYKWGTGACSGDSGGPLVNMERTKLLGIVSFGFIYCGGYTGYADAYTRVSNFTNWISNRIK